MMVKFLLTPVVPAYAAILVIMLTSAAILVDARRSRKEGKK